MLGYFDVTEQHNDLVAMASDVCWQFVQEPASYVTDENCTRVYTAVMQYGFPPSVCRCALKRVIETHQPVVELSAGLNTAFAKFIEEAEAAIHKMHPGDFDFDRLYHKSAQ